MNRSGAAPVFCEMANREVRSIYAHHTVCAPRTSGDPPLPTITNSRDALRNVRETARLRASYRHDAIGLAWRDIRCATDTIAWLCGETDILWETACPVESSVPDAQAAERCWELLETVARKSHHAAAATAIMDIARTAVDTITGAR